jgi:hypothetical protein
MGFQILSKNCRAAGTSVPDAGKRLFPLAEDNRYTAANAKTASVAVGQFEGCPRFRGAEKLV